jgi:hypothetical protein
MFARLDDDDQNTWLLSARDEQIPPLDIGWGWTFLGGRGAGKTRGGAEAIHLAQRAGVMRMGAVGPSAAAIDAIILDGPSGLMATAGAGSRPRLLAYKRRLTWPNGAMCSLFSAEEPDSLRVRPQQRRSCGMDLHGPGRGATRRGARGALGSDRLRQEAVAEPGAQDEEDEEEGEGEDGNRQAPRRAALVAGAQDPRHGESLRLKRLHLPEPRRRKARPLDLRVAPTRAGVDAGSPHSWRSIFRDWAEDIGGFRRETAEAALGHSRGAVEKAYRRETGVEARRPMMAAYANWLTEEGEGNVVAFPARA